jgi:putative membrane protein
MYHTLFWNAGRVAGPCLGFGYAGAGRWVMGLVLAAVLASLVLSIIAIVRTSKKRLDKPEAIRILEKRYATGELTKEAFEAMRKDLY